MPPLVVFASMALARPVSVIVPLVFVMCTASPAGTFIEYFTSAPPRMKPFGARVSSRTASGFTFSTISIFASSCFAASSLEALAIRSAWTDSFPSVAWVTSMAPLPFSSSTLPPGETV